MRVLLSAFACSPGQGSEPGIGWGVVREVARRHRVWVLTHEHNRRAIDEEVARQPLPDARFLFLDLPRVFGPLQSVAGGLQLYYSIWQVRAFCAARRLQRLERFDLVHHVTYGASWMPTFMGWVGPPFVWSAGGRDRTPWSFLSHMSWRSRVGEIVRSLALFGLGAAASLCVAARARLILSPSQRREWAAHLPVVPFAVGGLDPHEISSPCGSPGERREGLRIGTVGRLLGWKGVSLGLEAFAALRAEFPSSEYWILGDGPERPFLERLASRLGCGDAVRFFGWMPRDQVLERMARLDVVLHPSLHEQFGYAILEAMALGRPVVCLEIGGPRMILDAESGILVRAETPQQVVRGIHAALRRLTINSEERDRLGRRARERAQSVWSWAAAADRLLRLYDVACRARS